MKQFSAVVISLPNESPGAAGVRFLDVFREFNKQDAIECGHAPKTRAKYERVTRYFERYLQAIGWPGLPVGDVTMPVLKGFIAWLPENLRSCSRTHMARCAYRIRAALDFAVVMGYIPHHPGGSLKVRKDPRKPVISLEDEEFQKWVSAKWLSDIYRKVQDLYTFQMVTGVSYGDLHNYHTVQDPATGVWIEGIRNKTGRPFHVPLYHRDFTLAREIHEKYNGELPRLENHFYNRLIREMAAVLGIDKYLTSHTARKTYATLKDGEGWAMPVIAATLGNTEQVCRVHYVTHTRKKISAELKRCGA